MALYLARYLNVPPQRLPGGDDDRLDDLPSDGDEIRRALLDAFDRQQQVDMVAKLVARYLLLGHKPELLIGRFRTHFCARTPAFTPTRCWRRAFANSANGEMATRVATF